MRLVILGTLIFICLRQIGNRVITDLIEVIDDLSA